jgi:hypothetical protein
MRVSIALLAALFLLGPHVFAQEITATIIGTVTDPSGAAVSGAKIIVVNESLSARAQRNRRELAAPAIIRNWSCCMRSRVLIVKSRHTKRGDHFLAVLLLREWQSLFYPRWRVI